MSDSELREIVVTVAAPVEDVWRALREPAAIRQWFGWDYVNMYGLADLDAEIETIFGGASTSDEERTIRFREDEMLRVEPRGAETIVRVTRPGPADGDWDGYYDDIAEGWLSFFHQLRFALERHPGEERRTLHLTAVAEDDRSGPIAALGLAGPERGAYEVETPFGETLTGEVWFRGKNQVGVTAQSLGDGLVVILEEPGEPGSSRYMTATLTTYGLGDASFEGVRRRWADWWTSYFAESGVHIRA